MTSPDNPNFWFCTCQKVHSLMDPVCAVCQDCMVGSPYATQQQVNDDALEQQRLAKVLAEKKYTLPNARQPAVPTREQFEAALDKLDQAPHARYYDRSQRENLEMVVKRYMHHYQTH